MTLDTTILTAALALSLALVHVFAGHLRFLHGIPRSRWLSGAGGVSVAYVFVHILPELQERQNVFEEAEGLGGFLEYHIYLIALLGLLVFYGLERAAKTSQEEMKGETAKESEAAAPPAVFWIHVASFAAYNFLIGYLLVHREEVDLRGLLIYFVAMTLHFIVNDYGLRDDYKKRYDRIGRWLLAGGDRGRVGPRRIDGGGGGRRGRPLCFPGRRHRAQRAQGRAARRTEKSVLGFLARCSDLHPLAARLRLRATEQINPASAPPAKRHWSPPLVAAHEQPVRGRGRKRGRPRAFSGSTR